MLKKLNHAAHLFCVALWKLGVGLACALALCFSLNSLASENASRLVAEMRTKGPFEIGASQEYLLNPYTSGHNQTVIWYPADTVPAGAEKVLHDGYLPSELFEKRGVPASYLEIPPSVKGPFPTVVWNNGFGGPLSSHIGIILRMVSHGYIVVSVYWNELDGEPFVSTCMSDPWFQSVLYRRPLNVKAALDWALVRNGTPGDLLYGQINTDKIAGAGMSLGVYDMLALITGKSLPDGIIEADPRLKAVISLDGSAWLHSFEELNQVKVPLLAIGCPYDAADTSDRPFVGNQTARLMAGVSSKDKYRVDIHKTIHWSHAGSTRAYYEAWGEYWGVSFAFLDWFFYNPEVYLMEPDYQNVMFPYLLSFLNTHLDQRGGYQQILKPEWTLKFQPDAEFFDAKSGGDIVWPGVDIDCSFNGGPFTFYGFQPEGKNHDKKSVSGFDPTKQDHNSGRGRHIGTSH